MFYEKYITLFMNKISYFWKTKTKETPGHAYAYMRMRTHAQALCMHARVPNTMRDKFFCIKVWF